MTTTDQRKFQISAALAERVAVINMNVSELLEVWSMDGKTWCRHSGFAPGQWSRKRRGLLQWTLADLERICQGFGCTLIELLTPGFGASRDPYRPGRWSGAVRVESD